MKLRKSKQPPTRSLGRQRRPSNWQTPAAFSYHASRNERDDQGNGRQQANVVVQRRRLLSYQFWVKRSGLLLVIGVALICLISIVSLSTTPRIVLQSSPSSYAFHTTNDYQQAASKILSSSIWSRNKITVNTGDVSAALQQQFPELAAVTVSLPLISHRPVIYLRANAAAFVLQAINGTYVLDANGKALLSKDVASSSEVAKLPVITDQTGLHVVLGRQVISSDDANFIRTVIAELAAKQQTVTALDLPAGAAEELDVHTTGQGYYIKFDMHDSAGARQQTGTYLATAANLASQHITPSQYIDVRVAGRAYWQ